MKKLLLNFPFFLFCLAANAQQSPSDDSDPTRDIGFNTTFIFQNLLNAGPSDFSFMYKVYKDQAHAMRFGADFSFYIIDEDGTSTNYYQNYSSGSISIVVGKEKISELSRHWLWVYGGDIVPFYQQNENTIYYTLGKYSSYESKNGGVRLRPFLGIRFAINKKLYASAEASLNFAFSRSGQLSKTYNPETVTQDTTGTRISFSANPASGIFIYYRF